MAMHTIVKLNYMLKVAESGICYHYAVILFITLWLATIQKIRRRNLKVLEGKAPPGVLTILRPCGFPVKTYL